jgi:tetratricopeptide (TPR) repeat protein
MILILAAALASATQPAQAAQCPAGNDEPAVSCRALGHQAASEFDSAATAFEQLAALLPATDPKRDRAFAAAGNMWIAANEPGKAALALDRALAGTGLQAEQRGEALLDRARAAEAQNDLKTARAKVSEAVQTLSGDPFLWYFSAALAIREGNAGEAKKAIDRALSLAPSDPLILFEAGHVAHLAGDSTGARAYWTRAAAADPDGATGKAAREAIELLDKPAALQNPGQATK